MQRSSNRTGLVSRSCVAGGRRQSRTNAGKSQALAIKRSLTTESGSERSVRFRSVDEEFVFDVDTGDPALPHGSAVFETIMKEMAQNGYTDTVTLEASDDVFTEVTKPVKGKKAETKKFQKPKKSILKRRTSSSKR